MKNSKLFIGAIYRGRDILHSLLAFYATGIAAGILKAHCQCPADKSYEMY